MPGQLSADQILQVFRQTHALLEGHFLLTSGLHSPQYFQCAKVLQYPEHLEQLSAEIARAFAEDRIDVVISPAIGGVVVGTEVGRVLRARTLFAERKEGKMELRRGFELSAGERVLVVEDVTTTGGSVREVIALAKQAGATVVGVGCIVDRSNGRVTFDTKQVAVLRMDVVTYEPAECPMCRQGMPVTKPGSRGNY
jgi:orotate phosphoribosyltransferase